MGCGVAFMVVLVTCVGGAAFVAHKFKNNPEAFKRKTMNLVLDKVRPDWEDLRAVVEQLRTPEGCQKLYSTNPALAKTWPSEASFQEAASQWHKDLISAPELTPDLVENGDVEIKGQFGGSMRVSWSPKSGRSITLTFEGAHKTGEKGPRQILQLDVR
jgi:hypothetical protein